MAISRLSSTITLITQYDPNIRRPQKRVYDLIPSSSKFSMPTMPKLAQNSDCDDSNRLKFQNGSLKLNTSTIYDWMNKTLLSKSSPLHTGVAGLPVSHTTGIVIAFTFLQIGKVPQQLIQAAGEREQNQRVNKEEFHNIDDHSAQRYLQRSQMWINGEQMN